MKVILTPDEEALRLRDGKAWVLYMENKYNIDLKKFTRFVIEGDKVVGFICEEKNENG